MPAGNGAKGRELYKKRAREGAALGALRRNRASHTQTQHTPRLLNHRQRMGTGKSISGASLPPGFRARSIPTLLTGALLDAAALLQRVPAQLAVEVFLPKLSKPDVSAVVVQRPAGEVAVETCPGGRGDGGGV